MSGIISVTGPHWAQFSPVHYACCMGIASDFYSYILLRGRHRYCHGTGKRSVNYRDACLMRALLLASLRLWRFDRPQSSSGEAPARLHPDLLALPRSCRQVSRNVSVHADAALISSKRKVLSTRITDRVLGDGFLSELMSKGRHL